MNSWKKIANRRWELGGSLTSRSVSRHGLGKVAIRIKKYYNRLGKRRDGDFAFASQE